MQISIGDTKQVVDAGDILVLKGGLIGMVVRTEYPKYRLLYLNTSKPCLGSIKHESLEDLYNAYEIKRIIKSNRVEIREIISEEMR